MGHGWATSAGSEGTGMYCFLGSAAASVAAKAALFSPVV